MNAFRAVDRWKWDLAWDPLVIEEATVPLDFQTVVDIVGFC